MLATSSAKLSSRFSMPSPFSKRTKLLILISPPSSFAVAFCILLYAHITIFYIWLVKQANFFEEFFHSSFYNLLSNICRFTGIYKLVLFEFSFHAQLHLLELLLQKHSLEQLQQLALQYFLHIPQIQVWKQFQELCQKSP